jgi:two-component sensor histidine kinase
MTLIDSTSPDPALIEQERNILIRVAQGGSLKDVLRDLILLVEAPSQGDMMASILFLSPDGKHLLEGAAPSLPDEYNKAIDGIAIGPAVGSCGTSAFSGEPVFVTDIASDPRWADFREIALKYDLRACWSVPIKSADGKVLGTFANYYREPREPTNRDMQVIAMVAHTAAVAIERHRHDQERARMDEQRDLLMHELNHRVKNVFALANSLLVMTARGTTNPQDLVKSVQGRLQALSRAHELVQPGLTGAGLLQTAAVPFEQVIRDILAPYAIKDMVERVHLDGPQISIGANAVTPVALTLHELATNAAKYGALSVPTGRVNVVWKIVGELFDIAWVETGGPPARRPEKNGFGTNLTRRSVESQLRGKITYDWLSDGLTVTLTLPLSSVT